MRAARREYLSRLPGLAALLVALLLEAPAAAGQVLTLGMLADRPKPVLEQRWQFLADDLSQVLPGYQVRLRVPDQEEPEVALQARR